MAAAGRCDLSRLLHDDGERGKPDEKQRQQEDHIGKRHLRHPRQEVCSGGCVSPENVLRLLWARDIGRHDGL